jgi:uncharacterized protein (DUF3084 family)
MSTIGKIFLLFNLFLAGGFLIWASTSLGKGADLNKQLAAEKANLEKVKAELETTKSAMTTQLATERTAKDSFKNERDQAVSDSNRSKEDLAASKRTNDQLGGDVAKIQATLGQYQANNERLAKDKDTAVAESHNLEKQRDEAKQQAAAAEEAKRNAEEALEKANRDIADLEKKLKGSNDKVAQLDTQLQNLVAVTGVSLNEIKAPEAIDAKVVQVDYTLKPGLVAISAGSSSGVKKGYTFEIYSGTTYKGQVRVETVHENMSSGLIVFSTGNQTIGAGDSASTRL